MPGALMTNGVTHEQCALATAQAGYEVFSMQANGVCFAGSLADVTQMKQQLDDATCSTIPCTTCTAKANKVYSIGVPSYAYPVRCHMVIYKQQV